jgi:hypothetical protein
MRVFLSGWQATNYAREMTVINSGYLKCRCFSFANIVKIPGLPYYVPGAVTALDACLESDIEIMIDSGVVGWRSYRISCEKKKNEKAVAKLCGEEEFIQLYVDYVKKNHKKWHFYMTIDLERVAKNILVRHKKICEMGITPVPVFHGDDSTEYLKKYADLGHNLVAVASWRTLRNGKDQFKTYLNNVFDAAAKYGVKLHGLAFTSPWAMIDYPWYSVDSSSWSRVAGFGGIMRFYDQRLTNINISDRTKVGDHYIKLSDEPMEALAEELEAEGFNLEQLRQDFVQRHIYNARAMHQMAEYAAKKHGTRDERKSWQLLF